MKFELLLFLQNSFYTTTFHPQQTPTNAEMFAAAAAAAVANASSSASSDPFQVNNVSVVDKYIVKVKIISLAF
jgi:hypothetical protein